MFKDTSQKFKMRMLQHIGPEKLTRLSEDKAIRAFKNAATHIPAYQAYLKQHNVSPQSIGSIRAFKEKAPIINKDMTFKPYSGEIEKLCRRGRIHEAKTIISSSGHSGCFSFGLSTKEELRSAQNEIDIALDNIFGVKNKKALLINALPMGVKVNSALATVADTSVRSDIAVALVKTFSPYYDQIIIVAENSFAKKILEEGQEQGIDWKSKTTHLILGEEILPENLRSYLADMLGADPDAKNTTPIIGSSFGISEFGLNLFYETPQTIRIRRLLQKDKKLKEALIGGDTCCLPVIFQYNPLRIYAEEIQTEGRPHLVLTNLDYKTIIPLIRYDTQDYGMLISYTQLAQTLEKHNYQDYLPQLRLPLALVFGRQKIDMPGEKSVSPEQIKEALYENFDVARDITGYFRISVSEKALKVEIQLKEGKTPTLGLENKIKEMLSKNIPAPLRAIIYPYQDFPYGMELNYERKFRYL